MRYAVYIPNFGPFSDPHIVADVARETEEAGWDGVIPGWDIMGGQKQHPNEVAGMIEYIKSHRSVEEPFEVAYGAKTTADPAKDVEITRPYIQAGITRWLEDLNPWRGTLADMRERVLKGAPK